VYWLERAALSLVDVEGAPGSLYVPREGSV
jgi:hypothetical protein